MDASLAVAAVVLFSGLIIALLFIPRMWLEGALNGAEAALVACAVLALICAILTTWGSRPMAFLTAAYLGVIGYLPFLRRLLAYRSQMELAQADANKWLKTLSFDPKNQGAHLYLARAYVELGRLESALNEYEEALRLSPHDPESLREYSQTLQLGRSLAAQPWTCPACACENPGRTRQCFRCGAYLPRMAMPASRALCICAVLVGAAAVALVIPAGLGWIGGSALLILATILFALFFTISSTNALE